MITPAAKKEMYIMAEGREMLFARIGGNEKETAPRLFMPIITSNNTIAIRKIVLNKSFAFIFEKRADDRTGLPARQ